MRRSTSVLLTVAAFLTLAGHPLQAQLEMSSRASSIRLGGRLHAQYAASSLAEAHNDFFFRRARLLADITANDFVSARLQTDFTGGTAALQDAWVRLTFSDAFGITMGQQKRAFDQFETSSSTDLSVIERDARIEGLSTCTGVGGVCSYSRLTEKLEFAGRDQGISFDGTSGRVSWLATVTNGTGINVSDENDSKSLSGRLTVAASDDLRVSAALASHDYEAPGDPNARATGWGTDIEYGTWRDGLHAMASVIGGENWKALDEANVAAKFRAAQIILTYYHPLEGGRVTGVEPVARLSLGDPDTAAMSDGGTVFTPGLLLYFGGKNRIGANLDYYTPQTGDSELSFKIQTFLYF